MVYTGEFIIVYPDARTISFADVGFDATRTPVVAR